MTDLAQFDKRVSLSTAFLFFIVGAIVSLLLFRLLKPPSADPAGATSSAAPCDVNAIRLHNYQYIKPLLFVDQTCESPVFLPLKQEIKAIINERKHNGAATSVSVYLRNLETSTWMGIDEHEEYRPGSLYKVPMMITYLKQAQLHSDLLDRQILFEGVKNQVLPTQTYTSASIEAGKSYSVKELLRYMIVHSDNQAQWLLVQHMDMDVMDRLFIDMGVGVPLLRENNRTMSISARNFSTFMRTLFNSSYLPTEYSEFAMSMLSDTQFQAGMMKALPEGTRVARKFGEWSDTQTHELHESGIVYVDDKAFLLTVMTRGKQPQPLPAIISDITRVVYGHIKHQ